MEEPSSFQAGNEGDSAAGLGMDDDSHRASEESLHQQRSHLETSEAEGRRDSHRNGQRNRATPPDSQGDYFYHWH